jgi:hypothetical protein
MEHKGTDYLTSVCTRLQLARPCAGSIALHCDRRSSISCLEGAVIPSAVSALCAYSCVATTLSTCRCFSMSKIVRSLAMLCHHCQLCSADGLMHCKVGCDGAGAAVVCAAQMSTPYGANGQVCTRVWNQQHFIIHVDLTMECSVRGTHAHEFRMTDFAISSWWPQLSGTELLCNGRCTSSVI